MTTEALVETFHRETDELLAALEQDLLELETTSDAPDTIDRLFRAAHTLKGNAGMVGFSDFVRLTHALENVLDRLRSRTMSVSEPVIEASFEALDVLKSSAQALLSGAPSIVTPEYERALQGLAALCEGEVLEAPSLEARLVDAELYFRPEFFENGEDVTTFLEEFALLGDVISAETLFDRVPPLADLAPEACHLGLRIRLRTTSGSMGVVGMAVLSVDEENLRVEELAEEKVEVVPPPSTTPVEVAPAPTPAAPAPATTAARAAHAVTENIRVDAVKLDGLMDLVGELVVAISQLSEDRTQHVVERLETLGRDLQTRVMGLRMLPVAEGFERFRRPMRDLAKELGKQIEFTTEGGETQLDKKVIDALLDPLKHMLRNCVSHGLEEPAERLALGKPAAGRVHLSAAQREGQVLIEISDDGRGIDTARVLEKARERGLVADGQTPSERQIYEYMFAPGFSTAREVSEISGRGVGLDVVKRALQALRGSVEVDSKVGKGTTFRIRLPLTLAIVEGMNVRVGPETVTIPLPNVVELIEPSADSIRTLEGVHEFLDVRGELLPMVRLNDVLALPKGDENSAEARVVIVETERRKFGLLVDRVVGMSQAVVKPLDRSYELIARMAHNFVKPRGVNGAAILGNGNVGIILDVHGLESTAFGAT